MKPLFVDEANFTEPFTEDTEQVQTGVPLICKKEPHTDGFAEEPDGASFVSKHNALHLDYSSSSSESSSDKDDVTAKTKIKKTC